MQHEQGRANMTRRFGKLLCSIWSDDDFLDLTDQAKVLYASFISSPDVSPAGVLPLVERRWRRFLTGGLAAVPAALDELVEARFVVVDDDTAELWIRAFIRVDDRLGNPKLATSVDRAIAVIHSDRLRKLAQDARDSKTPGGTPIEGESKGNAMADRTGSVHESSNLEPRTINQQHGRPDKNAAAGDVDDRIIEAARLYALHRSYSVAPTNKPGFLVDVQRKELALNGDRCVAFLEVVPDASVSDLLGSVWGLSSAQVAQVLRCEGVAS